MCQVDNSSLRRDPEHHSLAQPDEVVAEAEVREKADGPHAACAYHEPKPVVSSGNRWASTREDSGTSASPETAERGSWAAKPAPCRSSVGAPISLNIPTISNAEADRKSVV